MGSEQSKREGNTQRYQEARNRQLQAEAQALALAQANEQRAQEALARARIGIASSSSQRLNANIGSSRSTSANDSKNTVKNTVTDNSSASTIMSPSSSCTRSYPTASNDEIRVTNRLQQHQRSQDQGFVFLELASQRKEDALAHARIGIASTSSPRQNSSIYSIYPNLANIQSNTTNKHSSVYPASPMSSPSGCGTSSTVVSNDGVRETNKSVLLSQSNIQQQSSQIQPSAPPSPVVATLNNTSRPRSASRPRKNDNAALDQYKCPTCNNMFGLYIYQCSTGHSSCQQCKNQLFTCGKIQARTRCNLPITDMRNIALESLIGEVKISCPNAEDGCCLSIKLADMDIHLKECPYKEMECPISIVSRCSWKGKKPQILEHFDECHAEYRQAEIDREMRLLNICNRAHLIYLVQLEPFLFLFHIKVDDNLRMVYLTVQILGTKVSAARWDYEIQVYNKREPRRKYQYKDVCHSDSIAVDDIFKEGKCATLPLSYAMTFINESCLTYKFYIAKTEGNHKLYNNQRGRGAYRGRGVNRGRGANRDCSSNRGGTP